MLPLPKLKPYLAGLFLLGISACEVGFRPATDRLINEACQPGRDTCYYSGGRYGPHIAECRGIPEGLSPNYQCTTSCVTQEDCPEPTASTCLSGTGENVAYCYRLCAATCRDGTTCRTVPLDNSTTIRICLP